MKSTFRFYYYPTEKELSYLWKESIFVFDANVLLNLYRYSSNTREEFISVLKAISDRIWIPYQSAFEYQKMRLDVISEIQEAYNEAEEKLEKIKNNTQVQVRKELYKFSKHPLIDIEHITSVISDAFNNIIKDIDSKKGSHPSLIDNDKYRDTITEILKGKIGTPYSQDEIENIYKEGERRYKRHIPPGYLDIEKSEDIKYGDLIIWLQMTDKAKNASKPMIFITDDSKEDWWVQVKGKSIKPRPDLINEFFERSGMLFFIYDSQSFIDNSRKYLGLHVDQKAISEVRDVKKLEERELKKSELNIELLNLDLYINKLRQDIDLLEAKISSSTLVGTQGFIGRNIIETLERSKIELKRAAEKRAIIRRMIETQQHDQ